MITLGQQILAGLNNYTQNLEAKEKTMSDMETAVRSILHKKYSLGLSVGNMVDLQAHLREAVAGLVAADESITDMLNNLRGMDDDFAKLASSLSDDQATQNPD